jgi:predicted nucleic acid-binding protein
MIFVDTGAWYAVATPGDPDHLQAKTFLSQSIEPLVTTDYIVDELLTLFAARGQKTRAIEWKNNALDGGTNLIKVSESDFEAALDIYEKYQDKAWSFTDCTSYVLMKRLAIEKAFSFDHHFRQFGFVTILP